MREAGRAGASTPGRQATLLEVRPDCAHVIGVDIGTEVAHVMVGDLRGESRVYRELSSQALHRGSQDASIQALASLIRQVVGEAALNVDAVAAVGVALTGIVDSDRGVCLTRSNTPGWEDFPIAARLSHALGVPVLLEETARAKTVAELQQGAAIGADHFLYVDAGSAVGAGIVIDRRPFRGVSGLAGELGHVTVDPAGRVCRCGNRGCVQAVASARAVVRRAREAVAGGVYSSLAERGDGITLRDIAEGAAAGDKLALGLCNAAGEQLGEAVSVALNILGVDLAVLGGPLVTCSPVVLEAATRTVQLRVLPLLAQKRRLLQSRLGSDAAARGMVLQAIGWLFDAPGERLLARINGDTRSRAAAS